MLRRFTELRRGKPLERKTKLRARNPERRAKKRQGYAAHLKSAYWKTLRFLTWQRDDGVCQQCGVELASIRDMQLAHRTTARFGAEIMDDVECNCGPCNLAERASRAWYKGGIER